MKILWVSEYILPTGFARVSRALVKQLQKKFDITVLDWYEEKDSFVGGVKVLGKKSNTDVLAVERLLELYGDYDAIFMLNDVWNIAKYLSALKRHNKTDSIPKIVAYFPVDAEGHSPEWYKDFDIVTAPVTYTEFASAEVSKASGIVPDVIAHGIDSDIFFKSMTTKDAIREHVYNSDQFSDAFVFFNGNRNQPRKKIDITVRAFAEFLKLTGAKNAWLHLHCGLVDYGFNIPELVERFGVSGRIIVSGMTNGMQNVSSELLNLYYNACDVGLNSSVGEGWGLLSAECGVTGTPQIVPDHSACAELYKDRALLIHSPMETVLEPSLTIGRIPDYRHMALLMQQYYEEKKLRNKHGNALREYFSQPQFNWSVIAEQWAKIFQNKKFVN